ncbi:MAG TPA: AI-2E family transporter, partial [Puia sp.]
MDKPETKLAASVKSKQIIHVALQLLSLALLLGWCFQILAPFFNPIVWGAILAVSLYPMHKKLKRKLKGRGVLAAVIITALIFGFLLVVGTWLGLKTGAEVKTEISNYREGKIKIPAPPASIKEWPLIGEKAYEFWELLTSGVDNIIQKYPEEVKSITSYSLELLATTGKAFFIFAISIIICGTFLSYAEESSVFAH